MKENQFLKSVSAAMLLETMAEGVLLIDTDGIIRVWNKAMVEMTGYTSSETMGGNTDRLRAPECTGSQQIFALLDPGRHRHCVNGCECRIIAKNGETIPVLVNARQLRDDQGKTLGILQTITDFRPVFNLRQEIAAMASRLQSEEHFQGITGKSQMMQKVFRLITLAAESEASVMILGESGTGKELVASAIQELSNRKDRPFIRVNCGAIPETLLESELFGHEKGAFTGAIKQRTGRFENADKGTIFLDEIGDISSAMQVKLLRVLQQGEFERVGGEKTIKVNVRVIAATNKDLIKEVREGRFREDLYYRLRVFPILLPSLRERPDDIPLLARHFISRFSARTGKLISGISREAMNRLITYPWPGNVRELENAIEYAFVVCQEKTIGAEDLPSELLTGHLTASPVDKSGTDTRIGSNNQPVEEATAIPFFDKLSAKRILRSKINLQKILEEYLWNKAEVGRKLGVSRTAVYKWAEKHKLVPPDEA
jgi:PAS domain S-box-containing protein